MKIPRFRGQVKKPRN